MNHYIVLECVKSQLSTSMLLFLHILFEYLNKNPIITNLIYIMRLLILFLICNLCGCAYQHKGTHNTSQSTITGNPSEDRMITYGSVGAATGAVIGNQMSGNRSEKRAIGAGVGAVTGIILADSENRRQQDIQERQAVREYEQQARKAEEERRRNILLGRTISDAEILRKEHEVEKLENEVARIEQERTEAEARARRINDLKVQKTNLEKELGNLKSIK